MPLRRSKVQQFKSSTSDSEEYRSNSSRRSTGSSRCFGSFKGSRVQTGSLAFKSFKTFNPRIESGVRSSRYSIKVVRAVPIVPVVPEVNSLRCACRRVQRQIRTGTSTFPDLVVVAEEPCRGCLFDHLELWEAVQFNPGCDPRRDFYDPARRQIFCQVIISAAGALRVQRRQVASLSAGGP